MLGVMLVGDELLLLLGVEVMVMPMIWFTPQD